MSSSLCNSRVGRQGQGSFCPLSISCLGGVGSAMLSAPGLRCSPLLPPHLRAHRGCRTLGRGGEDLTRRVGAELQLAAPLGAAG